MRLMPGRAGELPARLKSAWARLARPVLGLFRLGLPRCRRPDDRHDGANLLSRHVAEVRRQLQCVVCLACNIMHERPVDNFSVIFPEGTDGRFDSWHLRHTSPTKGPLLPDPSRSFPFGWGFHFLPWAAGPGEDAATKDPPDLFRLVLSRGRRPHDPDDGAKGDHFRTGGAGDGAGASASFSGRGYPTIPKIVPAFSAVTSRQFAGIRSP
jgi:hypothetical protein